MMDPTNPVIAACSEGMRAELQGDLEGALRLFERAWQLRTDDFDACVAAHYLARLADGPHASLEWNERCLEFANRVGDDRVRGFYPSLYLNIGRSHEELGDLGKARTHYELAASQIDSLGEDPYGAMLRDGVTRGLQRTATATATATADESPS